MSNDPLTVMASNLLSAPSITNFPADIPVHNMSFHFLKYSWTTSVGSASSNIIPTDSICLPLPANLIDQNSVNFQEKNINPMIKSISDAASAASNANKLSDAGSVAKGLKDAVLNATPSQLYKVGQAAADLVGGDLGAVTGTIVNPNVTMTFQGVNLKTHNFTWTLVPKNYNESTVLAKIIQTFKAKMLPTVNSNYFLDYPDICEIRISGSDPSTLYNFKRCFVVDCTVNYAPNGLAFYAGAGAPVAVQLSLTLKETNIWTRGDLTGQNNNGAQALSDSITQYLFGNSNSTATQSQVPASGPANDAGGGPSSATSVVAATSQQQIQSVASAYGGSTSGIVSAISVSTG